MGLGGRGWAAVRMLMRRCLTWQGFDEYMNLVLDEAEEMSIKKKSRKPLGELLPRTQEAEQNRPEQNIC